MLGSVSTNASIGTVTVGHPQVRTWPLDSYGERPANGYYVVVKVTAKADSSYTDGWFVSPPDFHAVVKGQHYDQDNRRGSPMRARPTPSATPTCPPPWRPGRP